MKAYEKLLDEIREDIKKRMVGFSSESHEKEFYHSFFHDSSTRLIGLKNDLRDLMLNVISEGERNFFIGTGIVEGGGCYVDFLCQDS